MAKPVKFLVNYSVTIIIVIHGVLLFVSVFPSDINFVPFHKTGQLEYTEENLWKPTCVISMLGHGLEWIHFSLWHDLLMVHLSLHQPHAYLEFSLIQSPQVAAIAVHLYITTENKILKNYSYCSIVNLSPKFQFISTKKWNSNNFQAHILITAIKPIDFILTQIFFDQNFNENMSKCI